MRRWGVAWGGSLLRNVVLLSLDWVKDYLTRSQRSYLSILSPSQKNTLATFRTTLDVRFIAVLLTLVTVVNCVACGRNLTRTPAIDLTHARTQARHQATHYHYTIASRPSQTPRHDEFAKEKNRDGHDETVSSRPGRWIEAQTDIARILTDSPPLPHTGSCRIMKSH